tara:strand:+ start:844 stop:1221 length:378 start_codon:yes stop_codon:yes gene_type:complete
MNTICCKNTTKIMLDFSGKLTYNGIIVNQIGENMNFDNVKKEVSDVILDVDMVLDDITAKAERQVEWRLTDGIDALKGADLNRSARALDTISIRVRNKIWAVVAEAREDIHAVYKLAANEIAEKE